MEKELTNCRTARPKLRDFHLEPDSTGYQHGSHHLGLRVRNRPNGRTISKSPLSNVLIAKSYIWTIYSNGYFLYP